MTRIASGTIAAALQTESIRACVLALLAFDSGTLYLNDGITPVSFGGNTYLPLGQLGSIDAVEETSDGTARPLKLTLSGVDPILTGKAQNEIYQNREVVLYLALIDQQTGQPIDTPETLWEGRMDKMTITIDQGLGSITLNCENRLRREPRIARYTDADQQQFHPGDTFFSFTTQMKNFIGHWGSQNIDYSGPGGTTGAFPRTPPAR